jgi:hypothetical protein
MKLSVNERLRYVAYAMFAILAVAAYFWLEAREDRPAAEGARKFLQAEGLPQLRPLESAAHLEPRRDLFAYFKPAEAGIQPAAPPPASEPELAPAMPVPGPPDLLSAVQVDGVVRQGDSVSVLIRLGDAPLPITVTPGERFGSGEALAVQSVQGRTVIVFDNNAGASRTFVLSEE